MTKVLKLPLQSKIALPNEVLPSTKEEKVGMLELAAPVSGMIYGEIKRQNDEPSLLLSVSADGMLVAR